LSETTNRRHACATKFAIAFLITLSEKAANHFQRFNFVQMYTTGFLLVLLICAKFIKLSAINHRALLLLIIKISYHFWRRYITDTGCRRQSALLNSTIFFTKHKMWNTAVDSATVTNTHYCFFTTSHSFRQRRSNVFLLL